ncbi:MAG: hypothetical protein J6K95_01145 [Rikenellaceae bacterium]|nr:hypothetical protein [Rikenellaceae bacterium]
MWNYCKETALSFVSLSIQLALFFACQCFNLRQHENETFAKLGIAAASILCGLLLLRLARGRTGGRGAKNGLLAAGVVLGGALQTGGIVAVISPLWTSLTYLLGMADGFFVCLLAWIVLTVMASAAVALAVCSVKTGVASLLRFDFFTLFYCLMLLFIGIYCTIQCLQTAMHIHPLVGFLSFLSLAGGGAAGYAAPPVEADGVVTDANGNPHYVVSHISSGRCVCTDGNVWRREPDGHYDTL